MFSSASPSAAGRSAVGAVGTLGISVSAACAAIASCRSPASVCSERLESPCSSAPERSPFPVPLEVLADVWDLGDV